MKVNVFKNYIKANALNHDDIDTLPWQLRSFIRMSSGEPMEGRRALARIRKLFGNKAHSMQTNKSDPEKYTGLKMLFDKDDTAGDRVHAFDFIRSPASHREERIASP